ncbi:MAG: hypothetical protein V4572_03735 [Bacteroidota bacterium]
MKKILIAFAIVLFIINVGAQQTTPATKTESCSAKHATMTPEEKKKCEAKCKAEGKKCTAEEKAKKSYCAKK